VNEIAIQYYKSPVGELIIGSFEEKLVLCDWRYRTKRSSVDKRIKQHLQADFAHKSSRIIEQCITQLDEYFETKREEFYIPIRLVGTDFQQAVWQALISISYGTTNTYLGLAKQLRNEKAIRAVASANGANAISIIVPCHRIIGSDNSLIGYAGGLAAKKKLLDLEKCDILGSQLRLF